MSSKVEAFKKYFLNPLRPLFSNNFAFGLIYFISDTPYIFTIYTQSSLIHI